MKITPITFMDEKPFLCTLYIDKLYIFKVVIKSTYLQLPLFCQVKINFFHRYISKTFLLYLETKQILQKMLIDTTLTIFTVFFQNKPWISFRSFNPSTQLVNMHLLLANVSGNVFIFWKMRPFSHCWNRFFDVDLDRGVCIDFSSN